MWKLGITILCLLISNSVSANAPLGIRNNNPGNLIQTDITWKGEIECSSRFECFESPEMGLRAMAKNLLTYQNRYELDTIPQIVHRWSPPHENRTHALSTAICKQLDIECTHRFALNKPANLKKLMKALVIQENGYNPYTDDLIEEVLHGISDTNGNTYYASRGASRRGNEVVGDEAAVPAPATGNDDEYAGTDKRLPGNDSEDGEQALPMDTAGYCSNGGILCVATAQARSHILPGNSRNSWLDGIQSGLPVLLGFGGNSMAHYDGPSPNPPRYPHRQPYYRPVFWRFNSWA